MPSFIRIHNSSRDRNGADRVTLPAHKRTDNNQSPLLRARSARFLSRLLFSEHIQPAMCLPNTTKAGSALRVNGWLNGIPAFAGMTEYKPEACYFGAWGLLGASRLMRGLEVVPVESVLLSHPPHPPEPQPGVFFSLMAFQPR
ncbi:hypothetical protein [Calycomorphotria hydatis]|uniref:Uncharacterized protein n=1 Tax=Calycomorphotria hydatis TaxID=2528027 RepID=A0A517T3Q2_9PLAN|nr:hypothetical protein [Calycomorphotria hydatis]QDT62989.1 hypothetical protein V22_01870 [Calycomorphotria hydatis]